MSGGGCRGEERGNIIREKKRGNGRGQAMEMAVHSWFKFFLGVVLNVQLGNPFDGCTVRRLVQSIKITYRSYFLYSTLGICTLLSLSETRILKSSCDTCFKVNI